MKQNLSLLLKLGLVVLASVVASMGGSMVADVGVWWAFLQSLVKVAVAALSVFVLALQQSLDFIAPIFDRALFLRNNDPLLI